MKLLRYYACLAVLINFAAPSLQANPEDQTAPAKPEPVYTWLEPTDSVYLQETINCPESFTITDNIERTGRQEVLRRVFAPNLPKEYGETYTLQSQNIKSEVTYLFQEGSIAFSMENLPRKMTCHYSSGQEAAKVIITVKNDPESAKSREDQSDHEKHFSSEKPYPFKLAGDRTLPSKTKSSITKDLGCYPDLQGAKPCAVAPMFMVIINNVNYKKLKAKSTDKTGVASYIETIGDIKRTAKVSPVKPGEKKPSNKAYIPYTREMTVFQLELEMYGDNIKLSQLCIPTEKTLDRVPVSFGASAVVTLEGTVSKDGEAKDDIRCDMRCSNDSLTSSCWQKKTHYHYTCNMLSTGLNSLVELAGYNPMIAGCYELAKQRAVANQSLLKKLIMASAETDPFKLLLLDSVTHNTKISAPQLRKVLEKHGGSSSVCQEKEFKHLCHVISRKLEDARITLNEEKRERDNAIDGEEATEEEVCEFDANGDEDCYMVPVIKSGFAPQANREGL